MSGVSSADARRCRKLTMVLIIVNVLQGVMSGIFTADALAKVPMVVHVGSNGNGFSPL